MPLDLRALSIVRRTLEDNIFYQEEEEGQEELLYEDAESLASHVVHNINAEYQLSPRQPPAAVVSSQVEQIHRRGRLGTFLKNALSLTGTLVNFSLFVILVGLVIKEYGDEISDKIGFFWDKYFVSLKKQKYHI